MISKPVKGILEGFDNIFEQLKTNDDTKKHLYKVANDINLLKLWREELESGKQSIFIPGKMSTGKSSFLNFLLDKKDELDSVFKTATKTETSIIQTLEHCKTKKESNAEIIIKNLREFKKLDIPKNIRYEYRGSSFIIPLDSREQIIFFREKIIAKPEKGKENDYYFESIKAIAQVNIKHPLIFFKNYKIIDTPGLGASKDGDETEKIIRENYQGKSHVFWFLDASKRTMSDNLTLLVEEKKLLKMNFSRIHFIANKFDLMDYDDDNNSKTEVIKRMVELTKALEETLGSILDQKINNPSILFTSLKKPKKKFGNNNTITNIENLEEQLLLEKKDTSYNNISSLITSMKPILEKLKKHVVEDEKVIIDKKIFDQKIKKKRAETEYKISQNKKKETFEVIDKCVEEINNIKKDKNLNTHERYNKYIKNFRKTIEKSVIKIKNALDRIDHAGENEKINIKLNLFKFIKNLSLKEKESFWKKKFHDSELDTKKEDLMTYVPMKIEELMSFKKELDKCLDNFQSVAINEVSNKISTLEEKRKNIEKNSQIISAIKLKLSNINSLLLDDLEVKISEWNPCQKNENSSLCSFLQLYSLLEEHELVMNKIN
jgi:hypothetical protein